VSKGTRLYMPAQLDCEIERRLREWMFALDDTKSLHALGPIDPELRRLLRLRLIAEPLLALTAEWTGGRA
jgi:hypothetical protein